MKTWIAGAVTSMAALGAAALVAASLLAPETAAAQGNYTGWWKCPSGTTFQAQGSKARCWKAPQWIYVSAGNCTVGQRKVIDFSGTRDKCVTGVGPATVTFDIPCPNATQIAYLRGADRCRNYKPGDSTYPGIKTP